MKNTLVILCLSFLFGSSCSEKYEDSKYHHPDTGKVQVVLPVSDSFEESGTYASDGDLPITRTLILGDGNLNKAAWAENDKISLWAIQNGAPDYALRAETFKYYTPLQGNALFSAAIPEMTAGTYNYYGAYPVPATIDDTRVTYTLPAEQNGVYDGTCDIMLARPAQGSELTAETPIDAVNMSFAHKCHILRIQVPTGRNKWGVGIKKLRIKFPAEVVGDLQFDVTNPDAEPIFTNGSNTVTLKLARPLDESEEDAPDGNYVWVFLRPGVQLNGQISFNAYDADGFRSYTISTEVNKTLTAGRITPLTLTIPQKQIVRLDLSITANNLGEDITNLELTTPAEQIFTDGTTKKILQPENGRLPILEMYYRDGLETSKFSVSYESENALLTNKTIAFPSTISEKETTAISLTVPYLFEENFSNTSTFDNGGKNGGDSQKDVVWGDACGLPGWSGNMYYIEGGKAATLRHRTEDAWVAWGSYRGRLDTSPIPLKEGKNVKVSVSFNYSGQTDSKDNKHTPQLNYGHTTEQGGLMGLRNATGIKDGNAIQNQVGSTSPNLTGSFDNITQTASFTIDACTSSHRLSWDCYANRSRAAQFDDQWVYIDNIKVQIVK